MNNDVIGSRITLLHLMITELIKHYRADDSKNIKHFILEDKSCSGGANHIYVTATGFYTLFYTRWGQGPTLFFPRGALLKPRGGQLLKFKAKTTNEL